MVDNLLLTVAKLMIAVLHKASVIISSFEAPPADALFDRSTRGSPGQPLKGHTASSTERANPWAKRAAEEVHRENVT